MEIIRADTDYAMRALVHLASQERERPIGAKIVASECEIPEDYAYKLLRSLTKAGLTESHMGIQGGFTLAKAPKEISLLEVVEAIQGPVAVRRCLLGKGEGCPRSSSCPVSGKLGGLQDVIADFLAKMTVAEVLEAADPAVAEVGG
jgi:Rrf2 family protein